MSRDASGIMSLPAGNPVITLTIISSVWANNTLNDIANELTNSIDKAGRTVPTANLPMGSFKHTGASAGTAAGQYLVFGQTGASLTDITITSVATLIGTPTGAGITALFASPPPLGTTAPAIGRFAAAYTSESNVTFSATAMAVNCALSNVFRVTLTANVTVAPTFSNLQDGQTINWFITQDATGSRTMTWPSSYRWPTGADKLLSTAANSVDLLVATYRATTGFWYVSLTKTLVP